MCTISYLPLGNGDYILTQNRDVGTQRVRAIPPQRHEIDQQILIYPIDPQGGGTWNAISETQHAFILNGADFDYFPAAEAVLSRGELCIGLLQHGEALFDQLDLKKFDHFTIILVHTEDTTKSLIEWRWDGKALKRKELPGDRAHFWISHGLYSSEDNIRKQKAFKHWYERISSLVLRPEEIAESNWTWQHNREIDGMEGFLIDRDYGVITVSIFQTIKILGKYSYRYEDIKTGAEYHYENLDF